MFGANKAPCLHSGRSQSLTLVSCLLREDKGALAKLVEAIRTNYNDRYDEVSEKGIRALAGE